jgi:hypothetical protein
MFYRNAREKLTPEQEIERDSYQRGYEAGYLEGKRAAIQEIDAAGGPDENKLQAAFNEGLDEGIKEGHRRGWIDALSQFFPSS